MSKMLKLIHACYISEGFISHVFIMIVFYSLVLRYQHLQLGITPAPFKYLDVCSIFSFHYGML